MSLRTLNIFYKISVYEAQNLLKIKNEERIHHFDFAIAVDNNDNIFYLYSLSMKKLNIPKCQYSSTLLTTVCIVGGVTSRSFLQVFLNI